LTAKCLFSSAAGNRLENPLLGTELLLVKAGGRNFCRDRICETIPPRGATPSAYIPSVLLDIKFLDGVFTTYCRPHQELTILAVNTTEMNPEGWGLTAPRNIMATGVLSDCPNPNVETRILMVNLRR